MLPIINSFRLKFRGQIEKKVLLRLQHRRGRIPYSGGGYWRDVHLRRIFQGIPGGIRMVSGADLGRIATALIAAFGWRDAYLIIGIVSLVVIVALAQLMKRDPQGIDLLSDGDSHYRRSSTSLTESRSLPLRTAARTIQFWTICLAEFAIFFCLLTTIVHIVPHARDQGLPPTFAAAVLSTIGAVSMLGRIVMGAANDRIGGKRSLSICFIILISSLVWLQMAGNAWMLFFFAVIYGFAHGGLFTVMSPMVAELFGTGSHGLLFGTILFSGTIGGSVGPLLAGYVFDVTGSYRVAFIALTALALMGLALIRSLRLPTDTGLEPYPEMQKETS